MTVSVANIPSLPIDQFGSSEHPRPARAEKAALMLKVAATDFSQCEIPAQAEVARGFDEDAKNLARRLKALLVGELHPVVE